MELTTTEQVISVTVLPGDLEVTVGGRYMLVTDTRGGAYGWKISLANGKPNALEQTTDGSAPGVTIDDNFIVKDSSVGSAGSTGGQWLFALDRDDEVEVTFVSEDVEQTTWTVGAEAVTKTFGTGKNETS